MSKVKLIATSVVMICVVLTGADVAFGAEKSVPTEIKITKQVDRTEVQLSQQRDRRVRRIEPQGGQSPGSRSRQELTPGCCGGLCLGDSEGQCGGDDAAVTLR